MARRRSQSRLLPAHPAKLARNFCLLNAFGSDLYSLGNAGRFFLNLDGEMVFQAFLPKNDSQPCDKSRAVAPDSQKASKKILRVLDL
jgi:hypothetical protein